MAKNAKVSGLKIGGVKAKVGAVIEEDDDDVSPEVAEVSEQATLNTAEEPAGAGEPLDKETIIATAAERGIGAVGAVAAPARVIPPDTIRTFTMFETVEPAPRVGHYDLVQLGVAKLVKDASYRLPQVVCETLMDRKLGSLAD